MTSMVDKSPLQRKRSFGGVFNQPENVLRNESFNESYVDNNFKNGFTKRCRYTSSDTVKENESAHSFMSATTMEFNNINNNTASGINNNNNNNIFSPVTTQQQQQQQQRKGKRNFNMFNNNNHNNIASSSSSSSSSSLDRILIQEREANKNKIYDLENKLNEMDKILNTITNENKTLKRAFNIQNNRLTNTSDENVRLRELLAQAAQYVEQLQHENSTMRVRLEGNLIDSNHFMLPKPPPDVF